MEICRTDGIDRTGWICGRTDVELVELMEFVELWNLLDLVEACCWDLMVTCWTLLWELV